MINQVKQIQPRLGERMFEEKMDRQRATLRDLGSAATFVKLPCMRFHNVRK